MTAVAFLSGLPRSGSTLLMNILGQNPEIGVSATSGLYEIVSNMRQTFTSSSAVNAQGEEEMNARFRQGCRGFIDGWVSTQSSGVDLNDSPLCYIDKSRGWPHFYEFLRYVGVEPKIIITVRDLRGVLASFERLYRANNLRFTAVADTALTTDQRIQQWGGGVPVGVAYNHIRDLFIRKVAQTCLFVRYEDLTRAPRQEIARIYEYLGMSEFTHEYDDIKQITNEDDRLHGISGLHSIESVLRLPREDWDEVLGVDLAQGIVDNTPWFYKTFYSS